MQQHEQRLLDPNATFATLCKQLNVDARIRKAIARQGFIRPTLVQSQSLPLAIESGRDLLVRARTGSGKTLAYVIPILQKVLKSKETKLDDSVGIQEEDMEGSAAAGDMDFIKAVILVPTRELCQQVYATLQSLCFYCEDVVGLAVLSNINTTSSNKSEKESLAAQEAMLRDRPDIIVSTPAGLLKHIQKQTIRLKHSVETFVVDEADLVLSFGYSKDISEIVTALPKICQGFLLSATLSPELDALKKVVLHSPAILKLEEEDDSRNARDGTLLQFYLKLPPKDKNLVIYVFLKLGLLKGKGLFFVNSTDGGYRLKLFLEQFHIRSAVLNAELPARSRMSIIDQFNAGNFDYLIATDESADVRSGKSKKTDNENDYDNEEHENEKKKKKQKRKKDSEYGVSRGLDFKNVSFVLNVDMPPSPESYTHRIGRTARGGAKGVALTLVSDPDDITSTMKNKSKDEKEAAEIDDLEMLEAIQASQPPLPLMNILSQPANQNDTNTLQQQQQQQDADESHHQQQPQVQLQPSPLDFELKELEGFRYRVEDVSRAVTRTAVRETRAAELKAELLNSERLAAHFEENPTDLQILRHDRTATHVSMVQDHLK